MSSTTDILEQLHHQWLGLPMTQTALKALEKFKDQFVSQITAGATNPNITDSVVRYAAVNIKNMEAVLVILQDFNKLKSLIETPKET